MLDPTLIYETVWNGGEGLSGYLGDSPLATATFPESLNHGDFKDLHRGTLGPAQARRIKDQLAAGVSEGYIRRTLGVSRFEIRQVREGLV